jgi:acetyl-CoA C-acetyltransferase
MKTNTDFKNDALEALRGNWGKAVLTTLLYAMMDRQKDVGCATLCLGGGNAVTTIIRRE